MLHQLALHPALARYAELAYGDWLRDIQRVPVSLHLRLGYSGEPARELLADRRLPPDTFYDTVFGELLDAARVRYLVFSDNPTQARQFMARFAQRHGITWALVDENVLTSIHLMARCTHHVLTSSTLSFWGAYLDQRQPHGGKTFLHSSFFADHGRGMVPPDFGWTVLGDDEAHRS